MAKRKNIACVDSGSSDSNSDSNLESELLSLSSKRTKVNASSHRNANSYSDSEEDDIQSAGTTRKKKPAKKRKAGNGSEEIKEKSGATTSSTGADDSEQEEGEVSDSSDEESSSERNVAGTAGVDVGSSSSDSSSDSEFDDGYDDNLMGDEEDRKRLNALTEKERETEIFKRIEQRDIMRTRWEIERKLKLARRGDKPHKQKKAKKDKKKSSKDRKDKPQPKDIKKPAQKEPVLQTITASNKIQKTLESQHEEDKEDEQKDTHLIEVTDSNILDDNKKIDESAAGSVEYFDPKERSKERKKTVEMNRTDDKRSNAMALLKAKREGKAKREEEEAKRLAERERDDDKELEGVSGGKSAVKLKASEIYSDDSGSSDWDEEKPSEKQSRSSSISKSSSESEEEEPKEDKTISFISTKEELNKLRLSRFKMEKFVNLPIFERTVMNCFVRISIGNNGQKPVYRAAQIVGVVETGKIYTLGTTRTNRGIKLRHGSQERVFRLEFISNQDFSDSEFEKWREMCRVCNVPLPTVDLIERKQLDIKNAFNYEYKDEDVDKIVEEKNRFRNRPTNYAMRKTCLMKERDAAVLRGDWEVSRDLSEQIEQLESRASELDKKRSSSLSLISYINDRNRKKNVEEAEKAIMAEVRANKGLKISDPFTRRITQPRMGFAKAEGAKEEDSKPVLPTVSTTQRKTEDCDASSSKSANKKDYSLYSLHDFEIDLDVAIPANTMNVLPQAAPQIRETTSKRSLNLEDYKKKRGLI